MKAEIIKELYVLLTIDDDKTYKSTFCPFRDRPFEFDSPFYADDRFEDVSLLENGNVSFVFKYCKEKDFKKEKFILEKNQSLVIIDTYNSWDKDLEKDIVHNYKFELHLEYKEVEVDDNNLVLLIKESADDSSGDYYNNGEQKSYFLVKEGEVISSCLSKKEQFNLEIEKVDGLNITLKCLSFARRPKYPYTEIHRVTVNPYYFAYFNVQGGSHSRYDSESYDWNFTLELDIKDAVKFMNLGDLTNNNMKENAILVRPDKIEKIYIDFSNDENICTAIEAKRVSVIHTIKTQDISKELGIHLIGYVDRHGGSLDNRLAAKISGYDEIYSLMLLCKTDDKWNNLPLREGELNSLYTYLTTGKVISNNCNDLSRTFFEKYGICNPVLPKSNPEPDVYQLPEVPYVILFRYEIKKMSDKDAEAFGTALFTMADRLLKEGFEKVDGVWLSPDKKYYINSQLDNENKAFNILVQAKEEVDEALIVDVIGSANGIMGKLPEQNREDMDTAMEEAID